MLGIYAISDEYIEVPVFNRDNQDPTTFPVQMSFLGPVGNLSQAVELVPNANTTWYSATWESPDTGSPWIAQLLVGPTYGVVALTTGTYLVLLRLTDIPEQPVLFSGPLVVS